MSQDNKDGKQMRTRAIWIDNKFLITEYGEVFYSLKDPVTIADDDDYMSLKSSNTQFVEAKWKEIAEKLANALRSVEFKAINSSTPYGEEWYVNAGSITNITESALAEFAKAERGLG